MSKLTAMQELKEQLKKDISYFGGENDAPMDKAVASYLKTVVDDIDNKFLETERQQRLEYNKFIVWISQKEEWYYDSTQNLWVQDGYKSRTTDELFEYFTQTFTQNQQP